MTLNQIHSNNVIGVPLDCHTDAVLGDGDALISQNKNCALAVFVADCGNVGLIGDNGTIAVVHCGWRGLENQIIQKTVNELTMTGANEIYSVIGPNIGPECYEFGEEELNRLILLYGHKARSKTADNKASLDIGYCIERTMQELNVSMVFKVDDCTKCSGKFYSYRHDATPKRQAMVLYFN